MDLGRDFEKLEVSDLKKITIFVAEPYLGAHTQAHGLWVGMGAILLEMLQFLNTWAQFE